jgi:hypothetical protein
VIIQRNGSLRGREDNGTSNKIFRRRCGEFFFGWRNFGDRHVAGGIHEFLELRVGDIRRVHPETIDIHAMYRKRPRQ